MLKDGAGRALHEYAGVLLALLVVFLSVIAAIAPHRALGAAAAAMEAVFYLYATGSLIAYMLQGWVATTDEYIALVVSRLISMTAVARRERH